MLYMVVTKGIHAQHLDVDVTLLQHVAMEGVLVCNSDGVLFCVCVNARNPCTVHSHLHDHTPISTQGQTTTWNGQVEFKGDEVDYVVSDLFASDFRYNMFGTTATPSRRLLALVDERLVGASAHMVGGGP